MKIQTLSDSFKADSRLAGNMKNTIFVYCNSRNLFCGRKENPCAVNVLGCIKL